MKRLALVTIILVFLALCLLTTGCKRVDANYGLARLPAYAENLIYKDQNISLYQGKWPDFERYRAFLNAVWDKAKNQGLDPDQELAKARNTNSMLTRMLDELPKEEHCFYHLEFSAYKAIEINGQGALTFTFNSPDGQITTQDMGLMFCDGEKKFRWKSDTWNGPVTIDSNYSTWQNKGHAPQHCFVRLPATVKGLEIIDIRPNFEIWRSPGSLMASSK